MNRPVRAETRSDSRSAAPHTRSRTDGVHQTSTSTSTSGLTNARTRIVGNRTGVVADAVVAVVKAARAVGALVGRLASRLSEVVTRLGWVTAVGVPLALIVGYRLSWRELVAVGYVGVILLAVAVVYLVGRSAYSIRLAIAHPRVVVGSPGAAAIVVENRASRRSFGTNAEIPIGAGLVDVSVPSVAAHDRFEHEFTVPTTRRGILVIGPVRTVRADPIGIVRRELIWTGRERIFVHPRTVGIPSTSTGLIRDLEGRATRDLTSSDVSFHALREYVPGDERRNIHWKSTAKTGTYMVRQFEETRRSRLVVALSLAADDYATDAQFEMAVSAAGSLGIRAIRDARDVSVVVGASTPDFAVRKLLNLRHLDSISRSRLLDDLAGVDRSAASLGLLDLGRVVADKVSGISVAFLICGSTPTPSALRAASVQFPAGVEVVAVVCDSEVEPGLRRVAGLNVLTIGYLDDLRLALTRSAGV